MPNVREIRRRIKSVQNTAKITKAMSMIAASKMRRAQEMALNTRPYSERLFELLENVSEDYNNDDALYHPLLERRPEKNYTLIHLSPDRGLTGGLNSNTDRAALNFIINKNIESQIICIGKKGTNFISRNGLNLHASFTGMSDTPLPSSIYPISNMIISDYTNYKTDAVYISYATYKSTTVQKPIIEQLIPFTPKTTDQTQIEHIYEPNKDTILNTLLPRYIETQIYHALLEAIASEQSARMVAMQSATDNANDMIDDLTLIMNKARQETITTELLDIVSGATAVE